MCILYLNYHNHNHVRHNNIIVIVIIIIVTFVISLSVGLCQLCCIYFARPCVSHPTFLPACCLPAFLPSFSLSQIFILYFYHFISFYFFNVLIFIWQHFLFSINTLLARHNSVCGRQVVVAVIVIANVLKASGRIDLKFCFQIRFSFRLNCGSTQCGGGGESIKNLLDRPISVGKYFWVGWKSAPSVGSLKSFRFQPKFKFVFRFAQIFYPTI